MNSKELAEEYAKDFPTVRDRQVAAAAFEDGMHTTAKSVADKLTKFFEHLIDTNVIDCSSVIDVLDKWQSFQNS